ncbi:thermonuclease family protein [Novosphingobium sp. SL115]|uniref:thermonuclease family protein n=1 Tax=Novosphingobium sp. SL115 TaxID=2995150 RepID=UPI0022747A4B|nr:thermonuclease family protein [Novosphingobium sp. SL115]MCY1669565.1 thermonuclease family protein [Novosphingobium sp. SL115]
MTVVLAAAVLCLSPSVHDGDTLRCGRERVRIANIDAPEMPDSPKCRDRRRSYAWCDFAAGEASRVALVRLLSRGRVMIERLGTDPYGRTLAIVSVGDVDVGDYLISQGLAKPWR